MLSREDILTAKDLPVHKVETPEWGEGASVFVRKLPAVEREAIRDRDTDKEEGNDLGRFAALVICDAAGERLFDDGDAEALGNKDAVVLNRIMEETHAHNGVGEAAEDKIAKNSETSQD